MNMRKKIFIITGVLIMVYILTCSIFFGALFDKQVQTRETAQMNDIHERLNSYINLNTAKYQSIAMDRAHQDDAYNFMMGNDAYADSHLTEQDFVDLDVNFMIFSYNIDWIYDSKYYDHEVQAFTDFSSGFTQEYSRLFTIADTMRNFSSVFKIGNAYYYIACSDITDSLMQETTNGRLILGRLLDMSDFEADTGCKLVEMKTVPTPGPGSETSAVNKDDNNMVFQCVLPSELGQASIVFTFEQERTLYQSKKRSFAGFIIIGSLLLAIAALLIYAIFRTHQKKTSNKTASDAEEAPHSAVQLTETAPCDQITDHQDTDMLFNQKIAAAMLSVVDGVIVVTKDGRVQYFNQAAQKLTGLDAETIGVPFDALFKFLDKDNTSVGISPLQAALEAETESEPTESTLLILKDHTKIEIESTVSPITDEDGATHAYVMIFRDISKKKIDEKQIAYYGYHDQLTGLYNRRFIEEEIKRLDTKRNLPITLVFSDVNGLKIINDAFGHQSGDLLLCQVAKVIRETCRADEIIARVGGDEFILLLVGVDEKSAKNLIERINKEVRKHKIMGIDISLSFGSATKKTQSQSIWDILKSAEDIMYHHKITSSPNIRRTLIKSVLEKLHEKSQIEKAHSQRVSSLCEAFGRAENMSYGEIKELKAAGLLHDIGKVAVDTKILNSIKKLSGEEWVQIKAHPEKGYRVLITSTGFYDIADYVLMHHERWDGTGYPKGLSGEAIPKQARMIAIADAYDAMTTPQPYSKAKTADQATAELKRFSGTQFDPTLVDVFIDQVLPQYQASAQL